MASSPATVQSKKTLSLTYCLSVMKRQGRTPDCMNKYKGFVERMPIFNIFSPSGQGKHTWRGEKSLTQHSCVKARPFTVVWLVSIALPLHLLLFHPLFTISLEAISGSFLERPSHVLHFEDTYSNFSNIFKIAIRKHLYIHIAINQPA